VQLFDYIEHNLIQYMPAVNLKKYFTQYSWKHAQQTSQSSEKIQNLMRG